MVAVDTLFTVKLLLFPVTGTEIQVPIVKLLIVTVVVPAVAKTGVLNVPVLLSVTVMLALVATWAFNPVKV